MGGRAAYGLVVADGMGGEAAGEVASQLAPAGRDRARAGDRRLDHARRRRARSAEIEERIVERFAAADEAVQTKPDATRVGPAWERR